MSSALTFASEFGILTERHRSRRRTLGDNFMDGGLIMTDKIASSKELTPAQKLIAARIETLANSKGICNVTNFDLAESLGLSVSTAEHAINIVCKICGYKIVNFTDTRQPKNNRGIRVSQSQLSAIVKFADGYRFYIEKESKTFKNKPSIIKKEVLDKKKKGLLDYLNNLLGRNNKTRIKSLSPIDQRIQNDGATIEDAILIIDYKFAEWGNSPSMRRFIRPPTLFSITHFPNYLCDAMEWDRAGRPKIVNNYNGVREEIKEELVDQKDRLLADWNLLEDEEYLLRTPSYIRSDQEHNRIAKIGELKEEIEEKAKAITERLKGF